MPPSRPEVRAPEGLYAPSALRIAMDNYKSYRHREEAMK